MRTNFIFLIRTDIVFQIGIDFIFLIKTDFIFLIKTNFIFLIGTDLVFLILFPNALLGRLADQTSYAWILSNHDLLICLGFHKHITYFSYLHLIIRQDLLQTPYPLDPLVDNILKLTRPPTLWLIYSWLFTTSVLIVECIRWRLHKRVKLCCL